jgi:hypothetical protein
MSRKHQAIDLMALYAKGSANGWNEFLTECLAKRNTARLANIRYALQAGMDDLAKRKLNDDKMNLFYIRLLKSTEKTMKAILRDKYPNPFDNTALDKNKEFATAQWKEIKKNRDHEFELFLRKSSY